MAYLYSSNKLIELYTIVPACKNKVSNFRPCWSFNHDVNKEVHKYNSIYINQYVYIYMSYIVYIYIYYMRVKTSKMR